MQAIPPVRNIGKAGLHWGVGSAAGILLIFNTTFPNERKLWLVQYRVLKHSFIVIF